MTRANPRVLLLEDSDADAELIQHTLDATALGATVRRVDSEMAFTAALRDFAPSVIVTDHAMASFSGMHALRLAQEIRPSVPVVILTGALDPRNIVGSLRAGAEDVLLKSDMARLAPSIEAALALREPLTKLSPRQFEVFRLVAEGFTTPQIAEQLGLSAKTIETHRGEVMKRLGIHDLVHLVRFAVRVGLVPLDA